ncbi:MAG: GNAT family N-acetyltransferase [Nocardioides sp.]|uniref:GNAT family N-acetyltransferase n=1 Tax=Nocardioides sp. TaxID=35761 RepID=UPI003F08F6C9
MTELRRPEESLYAPWLDAVADFAGTADDGSGSWQIAGFGPDRATFDALLKVVVREGDTSRPLDDGLVHCSYFWIFDGPGADAEMVGFLALRHALNDYLERVGGHIGYSVRPGRRREGHATRALATVLPEARALGLDRVLVTCAEGNDASARTIEANGGVMEDVREATRRYWIDLADR